MKNFNKANIYWEWGLFPVALLLDLDKKEKAMQIGHYPDESRRSGVELPSGEAGSLVFHACS